MSLSPTRWERIETVFSEAADLPPSERDAFLDRACRDASGQVDEALRAEVESLLALDPEAEAFLGKAQEDVAGLAARAAGAHVPDRVGPWQVVEEVGSGGMGAVYRAERADGTFEQTVALKLIRPGLAPDLAERFLAERQILAGLDHPHIARLVDGGQTEAGRPYLAMEFVDGEPITTYCDRRRLSIEGRLRLFLSVCEAVAAAHRNLVVHRDLKPSNILVTGDGTVKLLDFGIAKLLDERPDEPMTRTGRWLLTPEYAAPEQVTGAPITTATDAYGLGAVLYELLTGRRAVHVEGRGLASVERAVLEHEPTRPSDAVTGNLPTGGRTPALAAEEADSAEGPSGEAGRAGGDTGTLRSTTTERLRRRLRGDLDRIVLKALRKEPERRYASAEALAADVHRHLKGLPVEAQPDTFGYRARKFVRRHRTGVAAAALVLLAILGGAGAALWQADRAERAAALAAAEAERAEAEAERSEAVSQFLIDLFAVSDPTQPEGGAVTADEMLDLGTTRAEADLADRPDLQATVYNVIASVYVGQARYDEAEPLMQQALALWEEERGLDTPEAAETQNNLGALYYSTGDYDEAERLLRAALATRRDLLDPDDPKRAEAANNLGLVLIKQDALGEAEILLREAMDGYRATVGDSTFEVASALNNLGLVQSRQGDYAASEQSYAEALARFRALLPPGHPNIGIGLLNLGKAQSAQDRADEAMVSAREADRVLTASIGEGHPATQATRLLVASLLTEEGRFAEAETIAQQSLETMRDRLGPDAPPTQNARAALASIYDAWGRPEDAARYRR